MITFVRLQQHAWSVQQQRTFNKALCRREPYAIVTNSHFKGTNTKFGHQWRTLLYRAVAYTVELGFSNTSPL